MALPARSFLIGILYVILPAVCVGQELPNLNSLPFTLQVPQVSEGQPAAGKRVWQKLDAYRDWQIGHLVYLPTNWKPGGKYPVIFEYPGNGGYKNALGDTSAGTQEGCKLGYGLSEGRDAIWICLPMVDPQSHSHAITWWGDADETTRYAKLAIDSVCTEFGGDPDRLILSGFSRGAIACSYIGLRDEALAKRWRALFAHSHYDGVRKWNYADSDAESAKVRIARMKQRAQWISHEKTITATREFLENAQLSGPHLVMRELPFANHSADWLLKDIPLAHEARRWFRQVAALP